MPIIVVIPLEEKMQNTILSILFYLVAILLVIVLLSINRRKQISLNNCIAQHKSMFASRYGYQSEVLKELFDEIEVRCTRLGTSMGDTTSIPVLDSMVRSEILLEAMLPPANTLDAKLKNDLLSYVLSLNTNKQTLQI